MFRPTIPLPHSSTTPPSWRVSLTQLLLPLIFWIFVFLGFGYGRYANYRLALGPNSSHLVKASSVFVEQILVQGNEKKGVSVYGFSEKPELSLESNWTAWKYLFVRAYDHQGFSLWLNRGSRIKIAWSGQPGAFHDVFVVLFKGEKNSEKLLGQSKGYQALGLDHPKEGDRELNYTVQDDDSYYVGVTNLNPQSIFVAMSVDVSSKMYDTANANTLCQTKNGLCKIELAFPNTQYLVLNTPNDVFTNPWIIELSFVARLVTYVVILGLLAVVVLLTLKCIGACNRTSESRVEGETTTEPEADPLISTKEVSCLYGALEEDEESGLSSSSQDLYDGKICVICYDEARNCFFVPCGHCATCYTCAQRIMDGESKTCPICRRYIHRVRRMPSP